MGEFFGQTMRDRNFGEFRLVEKRHAAGEALVEHAHERPYATFVVGGEYVETVEGKQSVLSRGSVVLHPGGESHTDRFATRPAVLINLEIPERVASRSEIRRAESASDPVMQTIGSRLRRELYEGDDLSPVIVEGVMLEVCGLMLRGTAPRSRSLSLAERADRLLGERFATRVTLRDLAAELGVGAAHLARCFRKEIGCTVGERIRQRRIERASQILPRGMNLAEIALTTGFADQSHFTRAFRAIMGVTPGEYRRRLA
ncbi:MAG TPA: AraC family transcriptional regulator [Longimicrobiales bacterium]|nr:AraC family transcriptional regulator [Longimicrobiales bacterium]